MKGKTMTNKEWLMNLTTRELAEWLCDRLIVRDVEDGFRYTGLSAVKESAPYGCRYSSVVAEWLGKSYD